MSSDFPQKYVDEFKSFLEKDPDTSIGIAVFRILSEVISQSTSNTFMGVDQEVMQVINAIQDAIPGLPLHFKGAASIFRSIQSKNSNVSFSKWKKSIAENSQRQLLEAKKSLETIPYEAKKFLQHGMTIMTLGYDPIVFSCFANAAKSGSRFNIIIAQGSPLNNGVKLANKLAEKTPNLHVTLIPDSSIGLYMNSIDLVLIGTDIILEDGGLIAPVGTYTMAAMASVHKKPVYCACETFKFKREFILSRGDMKKLQREKDYEIEGVESIVECTSSEFDLTPPKFVSLLITEKGPIPPAAVTHELIKLLGVK